MNNYFICFEVTTHNDEYLNSKFILLDYSICDPITLRKAEVELHKFDNDTKYVKIINFNKI